MTTNRPDLFDPNALAKNRARAKCAPVDFLREAAIDDVQERLNEVNRSFNSVAVVTPRPNLWDSFQEAATFVADDEILQLEETAFDLVIHDLCLHWSNDPVGQIVQSRRALKPDGLFIGTLFGGQTLNELRSCLAQAEAEITGGLSARIAPMAEIRDLGALLQRAGLALPVADGTPFNVSYASPFDLMKELRQMGEGNCITQRAKHFSKRAIFLRATQIYAETFGTENGRVTATFEIITLTGWAPDAGQQQPLRPGSAKNRLADALGAVETKLKPF
ncbi:Methyltransferase domain-containing protein [Cognatiyoonia sediminum]|uniref:Methyltransferase domain-containing protein n=1 Tax=Cognatiyoonia sediminum TaxID=1508389 RepID=A0A1M5QLP2_9RHOB|nr:methyltransferase domain-containing protein [Cognatiyoonia sediminum]SHH15024.1 Methyltransferase domain-containing protein [Cognatiyoonia sediminum]